MKNTIIGIVVVLALVGGYMIFNNSSGSVIPLPLNTDVKTNTDTTSQVNPAPPYSPSAAGVSNVSVSHIKEFTVVGTNFSFDPGTISVKKGDTVKITFKNSGGMHDWRVDEYGAATKVISTGDEETITFVANKTGSFEYYCSVGTHRQMGMKGTLIVLE